MTTTFPQLLLKHATERPDAPALREKEYGIWQSWSWREAALTVRHMACGLRALGLQSGKNLVVMPDPLGWGWCRRGYPSRKSCRHAMSDFDVRMSV